MAKRKILMDDTRRELSKHGTETFPMTVSHDDLWAFEGKTVPIHWHDDQEINLLRECIKPGTVIKSSLTIDETECNLKIEDILDAVKLFYEQYYQVFQSKFPRCDRGKPNTVFLGGGSGFVSKTVVYPMFGEKEGIEITKDIFDRTGVPQKHEHYKDTRMRVSPHILKCTRYQGKEYMMGQCEIDIS